MNEMMIPFLGMAADGEKVIRVVRQADRLCHENAQRDGDPATW